MKTNYIKCAIISLTSAAILSAAVPICAAASETGKPSAERSYSVNTLNEDEKKELEDSYFRLEGLEKELQQLIDNDMWDDYGRVEEQIGNLRIRIAALESKAFPDGESPANDFESYENYTSELPLTDSEIAELNDACKRLNDLYAEADRSGWENLEGEISELEKKIAELEEKAFPIADEAEYDDYSYEQYADGLELTDGEKQELAAAYRASDHVKVCILEVKADVNAMIKQNNGNADVCEKLKQLSEELDRLYAQGASEEQLEAVALKIEKLYEEIDGADQQM